MKAPIKRIALLLSIALLLVTLPGCGSTRSENGVTIEEKGGWF